MHNTDQTQNGTNSNETETSQNSETSTWVHVSDSYPSLLQEFFKKPYVQNVLIDKLFYKYKCLVISPDSDVNLKNRINNPEFQNQWNPSVLQQYIDKNDGLPPMSYIFLHITLDEDLSIDASLKLQKIFHPDTLPDIMESNVQCIVKENLVEANKLLAHINSFQRYSRVTKKRRINLFCEFSNRDKGSKRTKKTGCMHKVIFIDLRNGRFEFEFHHAHNHAFDNSLLLSNTRNLVEEICEQGYSWLDFQNKMKETDFQTKLSMLGEKGRLDYSRFYYIQRKIEDNKAYLDSDVFKSLQLWVNKINQNEIAMFKKVDISSTGIMVKDMENVGDMNNGNMWYFGIILKSQLKFMTDLKCVFIDLADKLNYSENEYDIFTYTIVIKNALTGKASPIGFMICNTEKQEVLGAYLRHYVVSRIMINRMVINCVPPKTKAIHFGYNVGKLSQPFSNKSITNDYNAKISYCTWNFVKACYSMIKKKIQIGSDKSSTDDHDNQQQEEGEDVNEDNLFEVTATSISTEENKFLLGIVNKTNTVPGELVPASNNKNVKHNREIALQMIMDIKRSNSENEANHKLEELKNKFHCYSSFVRYVEKLIQISGKYWLNYYFQGYKEITNNAVESFNSLLASQYFSKLMRYRVDRVVFTLMERVLKDVELNNKNCFLYPLGREVDGMELIANENADKIGQDRVKLMVSDYGGMYKVKSFTGTNEYNIAEDFEGIIRCDCPAFVRSNDWCKHIFLYIRYQGLVSKDHHYKMQQSIETSNDNPNVANAIISTTPNENVNQNGHHGVPNHVDENIDGDEFYIMDDYEDNEDHSNPLGESNLSQQTSHFAASDMEDYMEQNESQEDTFEGSVNEDYSEVNHQIGASTQQSNPNLNEEQINKLKEVERIISKSETIRNRRKRMQERFDAEMALLLEEERKTLINLRKKRRIAQIKLKKAVSDTEKVTAAKQLIHDIRERVTSGSLTRIESQHLVDQARSIYDSILPENIQATQPID